MATTSKRRRKGKGEGRKIQSLSSRVQRGDRVNVIFAEGGGTPARGGGEEAHLAARSSCRDAEGIRTRRAVQQQLQQVPPVLMLVAAEDDESGTVVVADLRLRICQSTGRTQVERIPTWNIDPTDLLLR